MKFDNTIQIQTPEGISFAMDLASPLMRFFACAVDNLAIIVIVSFLGQLFGLLELVAPDFGSAMLTIAVFLVYMGYSIILEWYWQGCTVGKRLFNLRVVDSHGLRLHFSQVFMRNLLRVIDTLPIFYMVGGLFSFFSPLSQRLGDMVGNTVVVHTPPRMKPDLAKLGGQKFNSFREYPHLVARLRQRISPKEAEIGLQAILRRDEFEDKACLVLFQRLADFYLDKSPFPEEAQIGLTNEQLVRNVVEILYN
ncbi:MAG: RDD family protein [Desulfobulbaceae bacterium]|nr:RDD family protein [Desulfobulbaceae bacterium]